MNQTLPITLSPVPVPVGIKTTDINGLLQLIANYMQASVQGDVSFFQVVTADPTQMTTLLIFNSTQNVFKSWDTSLGKYSPITQFQAGDLKNTFVTGDSPQTGWIVCDGRAITDVPDISQNQQGILIQLFGVGGNLPDLTAIQGTAALPTPTAFSDIVVAATTPPTNQIANLPFSSDYNPVEEQNLAANTENLRGSQDSLRTAVTSLQTVAQTLLSAFASPTQTIVTCVFVGYP